MTLLKRILTGEEEDSELKTAYQYVVDLRDRIEETCELAKTNCQRSRFETTSTIIREPERGSSMLETVCYYCCRQSKTS